VGKVRRLRSNFKSVHGPRAIYTNLNSLRGSSNRLSRLRIESIMSKIEVDTFQARTGAVDP
jgi:hypothetical protein